MLSKPMANPHPRKGFFSTFPCFTTWIASTFHVASMLFRGGGREKGGVGHGVSRIHSAVPSRCFFLQKAHEMRPDPSQSRSSPSQVPASAHEP